MSWQMYLIPIVLFLVTAYTFWIILIKPCQHTHVVSLSSIRKKKCIDCYKMIDWHLDDDRQPLVSNNRDKRSK